MKNKYNWAVLKSKFQQLGSKRETLRMNNYRMKDFGASNWIWTHKINKRVKSMDVCCWHLAEVKWKSRLNYRSHNGIKTCPITGLIKCALDLGFNQSGQLRILKHLFMRWSRSKTPHRTPNGQSFFTNFDLDVLINKIWIWKFRHQ